VLQKVEKRGCKIGYYHPKLTNQEKAVLELLTKEFLTIRKIANRRQTTTQNIYRIRKQLMKKGYLNQNNDNLRRGGMWSATPKPVLLKRDSVTLKINKQAHLVRYHGLELNVKVISKFNKKFDNSRISKGTIRLDGNTIRLFKESFELYIKQSFMGESVEKAYEKGLVYCTSLFAMIEKELDIIIMKKKHNNITFVKKGHFAEINNELAREVDFAGEKFSIKGVDGKTWLLIDNSFNLHELETIHPEFSKDDMEKIKPFFDDLRANPVTMSEVMGVLKYVSESYGGRINDLVSSVKELTDFLGVIFKKPKVDSEPVSSVEKPDYCS